MPLQTLVLTVLVSCLACAPVRPPMAWPTPAAGQAPAAAQSAQGGALQEAQPPLVDTIAPRAAEQRYWLEHHPPERQRPALAEPDTDTLYFQWPVPTTAITSLFGERTDPLSGRQSFHRGVDLEARYGQVVVATAGGDVVWAGWRGGHGRQVIVQHPGGYRSAYSHLSQTVVYSGMHVQAGQAIGTVGNSGRSTGPHLHFEIVCWGRALDPLDLLGGEVHLD